jgi:SAM-dependent methyltransferase
MPIVLGHLSVASVLDVGCGTGTWLATLLTLGVEDVIGIDGDYVDRALLEIPSERFLPLDLTHPFDLGRKFDLAISVEVAEHLPAAAADKFVDSLVRHAPAVLFSAAIPGQGGIDHVNEQWPEYWAERFASHGFLAVDAIRPRIWTDVRVAFWHAQNSILYVRETEVSESLRPHVVDDLGLLAVVHPRQFEWTSRPRSRRRALLEATIGVAATEHLRRLVGRGD